MSEKIIKKWLQRIEKGINKRKELEGEWKKNYEAVYGHLSPYNEKLQNQKLTSEERAYKHYKTLSFLKTELPNLLFDTPRAYLKHKGQEDLEGEALKQAIITTQATENELNRIIQEWDGYEDEIEEGLIDAFCAIAISKTIFAPVYERNPNAGKPVIVDGVVTTQIEPEYRLADLSFQRSRVDPFKLIFDPEAKGNINKAAFVGEEINTTLEQMKASGLYDESEIDRLEEFLKLKQRNRAEKKDWEIEVTLYEIYDLISNEMFVICKDYVEDFLRKPQNTAEMGIEKHPYSFLRFNIRPGEFLPMPEITSLRLKQNAIDDIGIWTHEWAEKQRPRIGVDPTKFRPAAGISEEEEIQKLVDGTSDVIRMTQGATFPALPDLPMNISHKEYLQILQNDFDEDAGQVATERAGKDQKEFAIQYEIQQLKGQARASRKVKKVKRWLIQEMENILKLMYVNMPENFKFKSGFSIEYLNPDVDIDIDIESATPKNRAIERKQLAEMAAIQPALANSPTFLKAYLNTFDSVKEKEAIVEEVLDLLQQPTEQKTTEPRLSFGINPKWELLTDEEKDILLNVLFKSLGVETEQSGNNRPRQPRLAESAGEGTEGLDVGSQEISERL
jgi:hypothetical protein